MMIRAEVLMTLAVALAALTNVFVNAECAYAVSVQRPAGNDTAREKPAVAY